MNDHSSKTLKPRYLWLFGALIATVSVGLSAAEFKVADANLQACLEKTASKHKLTKPADFTQLKCHNQGIESMAGLEQFVNLESLSLYNNKIERIEIDLEKLTKLKILNLARNNLASADIHDLASIETIYLFDNGMEELTLANLAKLEVLKANNNALEHFSYSKTPKFKKLYIFNNQLETINIYDLPALEYMDCRQNPMPDALYDEMDKMEQVTFLHDGNAEDW